MMTIDEAIDCEIELSDKFKETVKRNVMFDTDIDIDTWYCDDTECIDEYINKCLTYGEEHLQRAKWLNELKVLKEKQTKIEDDITTELSKAYGNKEYADGLAKALEIINKYKDLKGEE